MPTETRADAWRFCIAPMMDRTDRHCRYFMRLLTRHTRLYTEMRTTQALLHGDRAMLLRFHPAEHPLALQLGGSDPDRLAACAALGAEWGYDEINLNAGCPSDRVRAGRFGACLMAEPQRVADCAAAMRESSGLPVTVKTRIGIDRQDSYDFLRRFVSVVSRAGIDTFIVHARKAWLTGFSPRQNREIPPLDYARVHRLKRELPHLRIVINGGLRRLADLAPQLRLVDGVMIGREAYADPYLLSGIDETLFGRPHDTPSRETVARRYAHYMDSELRRGTPLSAMTRHMLGLFTGQPGARAWRRVITMEQPRARSAAELVARALQARGAPGQAVRRTDAG